METFEIPWAHNEVRGLGKFVNHMICGRQEKQREATYNLPSEIQWIDGETKFRRNKKKVTKSCNEQIIVECHVGQRSGRSQYLKEQNIHDILKSLYSGKKTRIAEMTHTHYYHG